MTEDYDDDMPALPPVMAAQDARTQDDIAPVPPSGGAPASLRDLALERLDPETRSAVILEAADLGIRDRNDASWMLFRKLRDAVDAATAADRAAERIEAAARGVGDQIYQTTIRAGTDLKGVIDADIRKSAVDVGRETVKNIMVYINRGTEKIQEVVADLDRVAQEKGVQFVASWRAQASRAGEEQAKAALQKAIAIRWGVVVGTILLSMVGGALLTYGALDITRHILPIADHLISINNRPDCGYFRGVPGRVCGVN